MSQIKPYQPKPGARIKVIGAGLPRTATNSFCNALEILLDGPPYHLGVQTALGASENDVLTWIDILRNRPYHTEADRQKALKQIEGILDGYVATADPPLSQLIPELMEIYPDAIVVCTVREVNSWARSMAFVAAQVRPTLQRFIFFWCANLRHLPTMWLLMPKIFEERYGRQARFEGDAKVVWERHHEWLERIVPREKLVFFDVKDGWEPLCKALDVPVPVGVEFPRMNDGKAFEDIFKQWAIKGLLRWAFVVGVLVMVVRLFWVASRG